MNYPVELEGFESQTIEVQPAGWVSGPKLLVNGEAVRKPILRGHMTLQRDDGQEVVAKWKTQMLGMDLPQLIIDEQTIQLIEPLKWYEKLWSALPAGMVFVWGALGAIAGVIACRANIRVFRSERNGWAKYVLTGGISLLALVLYSLAAALVFLMLEVG